MYLCTHIQGGMTTSSEEEDREGQDEDEADIGMVSIQGQGRDHADDDKATEIVRPRAALEPGVEEVQFKERLKCWLGLTEDYRTQINSHTHARARAGTHAHMHTHARVCAYMNNRTWMRTSHVSSVPTVQGSRKRRRITSDPLCSSGM